MLFTQANVNSTFDECRKQPHDMNKTSQDCVTAGFKGSASVLRRSLQGGLTGLTNGRAMVERRLHSRNESKYGTVHDYVRPCVRSLTVIGQCQLGLRCRKASDEHARPASPRQRTLNSSHAHVTVSCHIASWSNVPAEGASSTEHNSNKRVRVEARMC